MLFYGPRLSQWGRKPCSSYPILLRSSTISLCTSTRSHTRSATFRLSSLSAGCIFGHPPNLQFPYWACRLHRSLPLCGPGDDVDVAPSLAVPSISNWLISATLCGRLLRSPLGSLGTQDFSKESHSNGPRSAPLDSMLTVGVPSDPATPAPFLAHRSAFQAWQSGGSRRLLLGLFLSFVFTVLVIPDTKPLTIADTQLPHRQRRRRDESHPARVSMLPPPTQLQCQHPGFCAHKMLGPLSIYLPQVARDGRKDYRLTWLALAGAFANIGTNALQMVAVFAGYRFDFTPGATVFCLHSYGGSRAIWLIFCHSLAGALLRAHHPQTEKHCSLSADELESLCQGWPQRSDLKRTDEHLNEELGDRGLAQPSESARRTAQQSRQGHPKRRFDPLCFGGTAIDVAIAKVSYFADIVGYLVVFISASFSNAAAMISGTLFLSFGAGGWSSCSLSRDGHYSGHEVCSASFA